jgi:integrase
MSYRQCREAHKCPCNELVDLRWEQIDFAAATLHVRRVKDGTPATHPIVGDELRALRRLQREQEPRSLFVFTSERGAPFTTAGSLALSSAPVELPGCPFKAHPHMLIGGGGAGPFFGGHQ